MTNKIFIAIPKIISTVAIEAMRKEVSEAGFTAIFAVDVLLQMEAGSSSIITFNALCEAMQRCTVLIANLTPCLGVEPDSDVIFQLGYMAALGKPVFSFTNDPRTLYERVREWNGAEFTERLGNKQGETTLLFKYDRNGMRIENMGINDHSKAIEDPGPDSYNDPMLEGASFKTGSGVLTPTMFSMKIQNNQIYSNIFVFAQTVSDIKKYMLNKKFPEPFTTQLDENPNAIYLAGPSTLLPDAESYYTNTQKIIKKSNNNITVITPVETQPNYRLAPERAFENGNNPYLRQLIYKTNIDRIKSTRMGIFNLTPFRGAAPHSSTIFEMGYMVGKDHALGRTPRVYGFSTTAENLHERIEHWFNGQKDGSHALKETTSSDYIYHFGQSFVYSRMIDAAILVSGGLLSHQPTKEKRDKRCLTGSRIYSHLDDFNSCAEQAVTLLTKDIIQSTPSLGNRVTEGPNFWAPCTAKQAVRNKETLAKQQSPLC